MADPRTWVDGELVGPTEMNAELRDPLLAVSTWESWTPTWTAADGTPTVGDGSLTGRVLRYRGLCAVSIALVIGSTTSVGTTAGWTLSLPVAAAGVVTLPGVAGNHGAAWYPLVGILSGSTGAIVVGTPTGAQVGYQTPFVFGAGDYLRLSGTYEVSSDDEAE